jgi:hypothetical protein
MLTDLLPGEGTHDAECVAFLDGGLKAPGNTKNLVNFKQPQALAKVIARILAASRC